jgi:hypothetical protein
MRSKREGIDLLILMWHFWFVVAIILFLLFLKEV